MCGKPVGKTEAETPNPRRGGAIVATAALFAAWGWVGLAFLPAGCVSPLGDRVEPDLTSAIAAAVQQELGATNDSSMRLIERRRNEVEAELSGRLDELEEIGPATERARTEVDLGLDLAGNAQQEVAITLKSAMVTAVGNNLAVELARLQPAINREDVINAEAAFDIVLGSDAVFTRLDEPRATPTLNGIRLGAPFSASDVTRFETRLNKRFQTGTDVTLSTDLERSDNRTPGFAFDPDSAYTGGVRLGVTQPLLRGFGSSVNTATIRLAENAETSADAELKQGLLELVEDTERAYWELARAWKVLEISEWLVDVGVEIRDVLADRRDFDTRMAQYSDAVARVEQRKADVIRARRAVRAASDRLKGLLNDPELSVGSEAIVVPSDPFTDAPIEYNLRDTLATALEHRPEIEQALLAIDDAAIVQLVADNARLPLLNLSGEVGYVGLDASASGAYENVLDDEFINYVVGLSFEYPLGNRAAEADYRRARLERTRALVAYRQAVQSVVLDVKSALRDVLANYELIQATRAFRIAQAENLRTLRVEERTTAGRTPEFLNLKFQRQETLAQARVEEVAAYVNFLDALAALYRSMGIGLDMHHIDIEVVSDPRDDIDWSRRADDR